MSVVAIHQPTLFPWLGWWDKLVRADVFVLLDDVQFPKTGGSWMNRTRLLVNGKPAWVTIPVDRSFHGVRSVRETLVDDSRPWRQKIAKTIMTSYGRAEYFEESFEKIRDLLELDTEHLAELNEAAIRELGRVLELDVSKLVRQSELGVLGRGNELLVDLCRAVNAAAYLTGDGADEYLSREVFANAGIDVVHQRFSQPTYRQLAPGFQRGLSVLDAVLNCGWRGTRKLLEG